ncbi:MAG: DUF1727 domain-containing protein [Oscillospiraceae bacterium]|nr:DUF1727 domain-containing protein [Oscillospiraceae bacterium]
MNIRVSLSVLSCKFCRLALRLLGRGGTDFPGRVALKVCPDVLGRLAKNVTTIIVTGTNGKTTTARMIEQALSDSGISYFANRSGANLLSGVTAEFAMHSSMTGKCKYEYAVIEADEAAFKTIGKLVDAKAVVVTNVFSDQLDRYGEVTQTLENIRIGISHSKNAVLCLNADDSLTGSLAETVDNPVVFYGVDTPIYKTRVAESSDAPFCRVCKHEYEYDYVTYGHLGGYRCPNCGAKRPQPQVSVKEVIASDAEHSQVVMTQNGEEYPTTINLPGGYNIYNACSTMACGAALGLDPQVVSKSLSAFSCAFGRMEKFDINNVPLRMILIKNPAGCNQVLNFLTQMEEPFTFAVCLTDHTQDGRDISWIWDVDIERLVAMGDMIGKVLVSGNRADDMALRFKYAGLPMEKLEVVRDYLDLTNACVAEGRPCYIMPTYTAMLDLRGTISKHFGFKAFWE